MTYKQAEELWLALNDVMLNDERFRGYRPVIKRKDGVVHNYYHIEIRGIYERT